MLSDLCFWDREGGYLGWIGGEFGRGYSTRLGGGDGAGIGGEEKG